MASIQIHRPRVGRWARSRFQLSRLTRAAYPVPYLFLRTQAENMYKLVVAWRYLWSRLVSYIGAALLALFSSMPRAEQHHGVHICRVLGQQGFDDRDLLAAALLHDVGKTVAPLRLWERVSVVLVERFAPRLAAEWADIPAGGTVPVGVRRGLVVSRHHPAWGADLAAQAGASPRTVAWIRQHHDPVVERDPLLMALQDADEAW